MALYETMRPRPGLRVLVTAGASGIGAVIARAFAEVEARVLVCDVDETALARFLDANPGLAGVVCDVADEARVDALFGEVESRLGGLDVLVNNAGIAGPTGGVAEISPADWRRTLDVNITGMFLCTRLAVPLLRKAEDGAIINLSSVAGRLGYAFRTPYAASKWAVVGFTQSLAKELGPEGIRVNAILPGVVRGERIERVFAARAAALGVPVEQVRQSYLDKVSLRRMVEPEDMAAMALYLCSPAGRNISGQALSVCGNTETI
ncbi:MAG: SDR family oxidoreductase [Geminicoccaceae bacterium]|nr:SDR family oxidoreductase [Geminicoccaceae bacterium]MCX8099754.1 SDR family oxidoreductase [Geminicoccaceae bacterium]MDW8369164.1 SDR family oxidoreductase [Geminicoccaceae bacterium]